MSKAKILGNRAKPDYLIATLTGDQSTDLAATDHIEFETTEEVRGSNIILSAGVGQAAGIITLKAGFTYQLLASLRFVFATVAGFAQIDFFDITNAAVLGVAGTFRPPGSTSVVQAQDQVLAWVTPATDITVDVRVTAVGNLTSLTAINSALIIKQID